MLQVLMLIALAYLFGSINGAYYAAKFMSGNDIRLVGSGNAGARNAGRYLGKKGFLLTLFIDVGKTLIVLTIVKKGLELNNILLIFSAVFVLVGHIWPLHLEFRGGKGVVVFLAVTLFMIPAAILIAGVVLGSGYLLFRKFTITGFFAMLTIPITSWYSGQTWTETIGLLFMLILVLLVHIFPRKGTKPSTSNNVGVKS